MWRRFWLVETWVSERRIQNTEEVNVIKILTDGFSQIGDKHRQGIRKYSAKFYLKKER